MARLFPEATFSAATAAAATECDWNNAAILRFAERYDILSEPRGILTTLFVINRRESIAPSRNSGSRSFPAFPCNRPGLAAFSAAPEAQCAQLIVARSATGHSDCLLNY